MSTPHVCAITAELFAQPQPLVVVEWGAGGSTVYWSRLLASKGVKFEWHAIEAVPRYALWVGEQTRGLPVTVHGFDYGTEQQEDLRGKCMGEYVDAPRSIGLRPHVVLVDGRKRSRCIAVAQDILAPDGVIVLHDAEREYYHAACMELKIEKLVGETTISGDTWLMRKS